MDLTEVYDKLFSALEKHSLDVLTQTASEILDTPIAVTNDAYIMLSKYPTAKMNDEQWDKSPISAQIKTRYLDEIELYDSTVPNSIGAVIALRDQGLSSQRPRIIAYLRQNGNFVGTVTSLLMEESDLEWCMSAMVPIARAFTIAMTDNSAGRRALIDISDIFFKGLLTGGYETPDDYIIASSNLEVSFNPPFLLLAIQKRKSFNEALGAFLITELKAIAPDVLTTLVDGTIYVLFQGIPSDSGVEPPSKDLVRLVKKHKAQCGISNRFNDPYLMPSYKWQADTALKVGIQRSSSKSVFYFNELTVETALSVMEDHVPLNELLHPAISVLSKYDNEHGTDFLLTLRTCVMRSDSQNDICNLLHIHRNSLKNRQNRIEELAGIHLNDMDERVRLYLSFLIMERL